MLRNFHDMSWCADVITDLKVVGNRGANELATAFCNPIYSALLAARKRHFGG